MINLSNIQLGNARLWQERRGEWWLVSDSGRIVARIRKTPDGSYHTGGEFYADLESAKRAAENQP